MWGPRGGLHGTGCSRAAGGLFRKRVQQSPLAKTTKRVNHAPPRGPRDSHVPLRCPVAVQAETAAERKERETVHVADKDLVHVWIEEAHTLRTTNQHQRCICLHVWTAGYSMNNIIHRIFKIRTCSFLFISFLLIITHFAQIMESGLQ